MTPQEYFSQWQPPDSLELSVREKEIVKSLMAGKSHKEICLQKNLKSIVSYCESICTKLNAQLKPGERAILQSETIPLFWFRFTADYTKMLVEVKAADFYYEADKPFSIRGTATNAIAGDSSRRGLL